VWLGSREAAAETAAERAAGRAGKEIQGREIKGGPMIERGRAAADAVVQREEEERELQLQREEEERELQLLYSQMDAMQIAIDRVTLERQREQESRRVLEERAGGRDCLAGQQGSSVGSGVLGEAGAASARCSQEGQRADRESGRDGEGEAEVQESEEGEGWGE